jgi:hypothetical protein
MVWHPAKKYLNPDGFAPGADWPVSIELAELRDIAGFSDLPVRKRREDAIVRALVCSDHNEQRILQ